MARPGGSGTLGAEEAATPRTRRDIADQLPPSLRERFEPIQLLGRGSFGRVLLAQDRKLERRVAVKIMAGGGEKESMRRRFAREARLTSSVRHPNLVEVYDHGFDDNRIPYIVYEYLAGGSLRERLEAGLDVPLGGLVGWIADVASALHALHREGILHRDVKAPNLLFRNPDTLVLCDLGLAIGDPDGTALTPTGARVGSLDHMGPELLQGGVATAQSDLWALGAALYRCLYRQPIFPGRSLGQFVAWAESGAPCDIPPQFEGQNPELEEYLAVLLAADPAARPASAERAAEELRGLTHARLRPYTPRSTRSRITQPAGPGPAAPPGGAPPTTFSGIFRDERQRLLITGTLFLGLVGGVLVGALASWSRAGPGHPAPTPPTREGPPPSPPPPVPGAEILAPVEALEELLAKAGAPGGRLLIRPEDRAMWRAHLDALAHDDLPQVFTAATDAVVDWLRATPADPDAPGPDAQFERLALGAPTRVLLAFASARVRYQRSALRALEQTRGDARSDALAARWPAIEEALIPAFGGFADRVRFDLPAGDPRAAVLRCLLEATLRQEGVGSAAGSAAELLTSNRAGVYSAHLGTGLAYALGSVTSTRLLDCPTRTPLLEKVARWVVRRPRTLDARGRLRLAGVFLQADILAQRLCPPAEPGGEAPLRLRAWLDVLGNELETSPLEARVLLEDAGALASRPLFQVPELPPASAAELGRLEDLRARAAPQW